MTGFERGHTDSSLVAQTPEGVEFALYPAGLPIRACALGIDTGIQWLIIIALVIAYSQTGLGNLTGQWMLLILTFCIDWFYHVISELFGRGQSPGKRIMGIRVVRGDGAPVSPGASFLRNLLRFADTFLYLYHIALVSMAASPGFRRLGDWAADTLVVYTSQAPARRAALTRISGAAPVNPPRRLSYEEKQGILMFARRYPLLGKDRGDEIARGYAGLLRGQGPEDSPGLSPAEYLLGIARRLSGDAPAGAGR
jgi:uncharacterized RDD family membrane protein YckC